MAVRAPHLHLTLRSFCLGAFVFLGRALEEGDDLPFAFEEHVQRDGPALYEYRPLVRTFVESRASALAGREDARIALDELLREPAAAIFARAHAGSRPSEEQALFRTVLLSLLISTAESCGGFDWDDTVLRARVRRARALALRHRPRLRGRRAARRDLGRDAGRARRRESASAPPRPASSPTTGPRRRASSRATSGARSTATACSSWSAASRPGPSRPTRPPSSPTPSPRSASPPPLPSPPGRSCSSGSTGGRSGSGRSCRSRPRSRPASRRGSTPSAPSSRASCSRAWRSPMPTPRSPRRSTAGSSRSSSTSRSGRSSSAAPSTACSATPGSCAPRCCSATRARSAGPIHAALRALASGEQASQRAEDAVRRSLVETLRHGDRAALVRSLDDTLLGLRTAPRLAETG